MEMYPVDSGSVRAVGYDPETEGLHVQMTDGTLYQFMEVPLDVYQTFETAASKEALVERLKREYRFVELT
jgi:KTSC domain